MATDVKGVRNGDGAELPTDELFHEFGKGLNLLGRWPGREGMTHTTTWPQGPGRSAEVSHTTLSAEFELWVAPHWAAMQRLADRLAPSADADDVVQESLSRAWRRFATFDPERGTPKAWLLAIVADQASKAWRRSIRSVPVEVVPARPPTESTMPDVDLRRAVASLPQRQQLAVALFYYLDLPLAEVASTMACAPGTVKSTLWAARAALKSAPSGLGGTDRA